MDILVSRTLYMSCQAGPGIEPGPSALRASALPIELTWQILKIFTIVLTKLFEYVEKKTINTCCYAKLNKIINIQ